MKSNACKTQITVRLPEELLKQIQRLAAKERRNRSNMIEYLLRESMQAGEKE